MVWLYYKLCNSQPSSINTNANLWLYRVNVQSVVERQYLHMIGKSKSTISDQLIYVEERVKELQNALSPIAFQGRKYEDRLRFFSGKDLISMTVVLSDANCNCMHIKGKFTFSEMKYRTIGCLANDNIHYTVNVDECVNERQNNKAVINLIPYKYIFGWLFSKILKLFHNKYFHAVDVALIVCNPAIHVSLENH